MFDNLIGELRRRERESVRLPVGTDANSYSDRECPNEEC